MAYRINMRANSLSSSQPPLAQKLTNDPVTQKTASNTVTCFYQTHIGGYWRYVTVLWSKDLSTHFLSISVATMESDYHQTCKIDLKPWQFWAKKGCKTFQVDGNQLDVYWDFRSAKYSGSPEPCSDFYVALVSDEEMALLLGDYTEKAYKRTKSEAALVDAMLVYKEEHVFGKKSFSTRAKFDHRKKEHDIVVESSTSGPREPEMWISIDGIVLIHIRNLQWKFRGNQTILVNKQPVQVFWDVYAWLFCVPGSNHALFIFKPGAPEVESDKDESFSHGDGSDCSGDSKYYSTISYSQASRFCLFLYAWKIE
ncbi:uncharacterized protein LOC111375404 [Olea europaea var. sylvestris]|uniref:uncharacterized protein LOC111375404 n=1 Tax=Olea europaea var. sylvestris TaxID=158386 RepID=UPI000C1D5A36|nr:uncharacterized protein LOC111375404 [Olea europaea var. sylvestris]